MMDKFKSQKFQVFKYLAISSKHLKIFSKFSVGTTASCNILNQLKAGLSVFEKRRISRNHLIKYSLTKSQARIRNVVTEMLKHIKCRSI